MKHHLPLKFLPAAMAALIVASCNRDGVKVYHVNVDSNDTTVAAAAPTQMAAQDSRPAAMPTTMPAGLLAPDNSELPQLKYTVPSGWTEKPPSQMRVASFEISQNGKSVDVSVVPLGGMGGGDFANVNRWRGQVGLQPTEDGIIQQSAEKVTVAGQPADLYDIAGAASGGNDAQRIIAVILHRDEMVWFFKMDGDSQLAEQQKPAFVSMLKSLQFSSSSGSSTSDMNQPPPSHPIGDASGSDAPVAKPKWTVPEGWREGPAAQFLVAKYVITGTNDTTADVNISALANDGGGVGPNIDRWRGQVGLPAADDTVTTKLDETDNKAQVVDFAGTDAKTGKPARLIGVIVPRGSQTWFYKLMGDPDLVEQQKDAFKRFIRSAQYPSDAH